MTEENGNLMITRSLDAPPEQVWRAWTEPGELAIWWWPARFQTTHQVDLREGGGYRFRSADLPDVGALDVSGTFLEVKRPYRLAYTWRWEHEPGGGSNVSVEFVDRGGQTEVRLRHTGLASAEERDNHVVGWNDCLDRLAVHTGGL